ncbi:hypothetical protein M501DRAFT_916172, partial [Patellaria atrata CBS 101060]
SSSTQTPYSNSPFTPTGTTAPRSGSSRRSYDARTSSRRSRRMTGGDIALHQYTDLSGMASVAEHELVEFDPGLPLRSRSSWMKRLSTLSSSHASSPSSSPRPESPTVSVSNGSTAFSYNGSTAPIIGKPSPPPLPPNKLVKRSSSQRTIHGSPSDSHTSRRPTLRRPATSHQRSATLQRRSSLMAISTEGSYTSNNPFVLLEHEDVQWRQFFSPKVAKEGVISKKRVATSDSRSIKRIYPDGKHTATLLMAQAVAPSSVEFDDSLSQDGDSIYFGSRPVTPSGLLLSPTCEDPSALTDPLRDTLVSESGSLEHRSPRRSFSISDLIATNAQSWKSRPSKAQSITNPSKRIGRRTFSAPLLTMGSRQSVTAHGDFERPSKKRDFTDPTASKRSLFSPPAGKTSNGDSYFNVNNVSSFTTRDLPSGPPAVPTADSKYTSPPTHSHSSQSSIVGSTRVPPSPTLVQANIRPSRHSVTPSEQASTLVGSDSETRGVGSGEEDDVDVQCETVFDSIRPGMTRNQPRGPLIETMFDDSVHHSGSKGKISPLKDLLVNGVFREQPMDFKDDDCIIEEEESISTPIKLTFNEVSPENGEHWTAMPLDMSSSALTEIHSSNPASRDQDGPLDGYKAMWTLNDENEEEDWDRDQDTMGITEHVATPLTLRRSNPMLVSSFSSPLTALPRPSIEAGERDAKSNLFDWAEQQPSDNSPGNGAPPRPKTVHGKKNLSDRGSRSVGRRAPSALHARSQSVPVVPDIGGKRDTTVTNKFGTWGVGSKGVSEDWNDDFDFEETRTNEPVGEGSDGNKRVDSGHAMFVPQSIREQQSNVLANIGLLREWGLLIEELKELRIRASNLGILAARKGDVWEEVDAMIDLADQEAEEPVMPPQASPPSSPGFDFDAFEEAPPKKAGQRRKSGLSFHEESTEGHPIIATTTTARPRRKSVLPPNGDIFNEPKTDPTPNIASKPSTPVTNRPRKDSEAAARSVIEALQKRKSTVDHPLPLQPVPAGKKVEFDTATLRRIVPYVSVLMRKVKEIIREAEGLYSSPAQSPKPVEPALSLLFREPPDSS